MKELLEKINDFEYLLSKDNVPGMNADVKLFVSEQLLEDIDDETIIQVSNVAKLPGVVSPVVLMPDAHLGYGMPIGATAAFDEEEGIISAGMVGFDINCGINLLRTNMNCDEIKPKLKELTQQIFKLVPAGVGAKGRLSLTRDELDQVLMYGGKWVLKKGYATETDLKNHEENGYMDGVDVSKISNTAKSRGLKQLGTLGAGNHFIEIQRIDKIFDNSLADKLGLFENQVVIMIHSGSRGLGHQIATDYLRIHESAAEKYRIALPDKQLAGVPIKSPEGQAYYNAMKGAVNFAFANRLLISYFVKEAFEKTFAISSDKLGLETVYGIAHNICKIEEHKVDGKTKRLYVHRKGATRSFPNTPVIIAGSMGTASYVLMGTEKAMELSFGTSCHGAGRLLSRHKAIESFTANEIKKELEKEGKILMAKSDRVIREEAPLAYKDVDEVIRVVDSVGISKKVARMVPLSVIKG